MTKLTKRDVQGIKRWLKDRDSFNCPFNHVCCLSYGFSAGWEKCKLIFPRLRVEPNGHKVCPCQEYPKKFIVRKAKETIEKYESTH